MTWGLLDAGEARLAAAVPFYGPAPDDAGLQRRDAAVLGIYAELDARVNASRDAAEAALVDAGLTHEIRTFPGVDHAFFNDTGARYDEAAADEAWTLVLDWFDHTHLDLRADISASRALAPCYVSATSAPIERGGAALRAGKDVPVREASAGSSAAATVATPAMVVAGDCGAAAATTDRNGPVTS